MADDDSSRFADRYWASADGLQLHYRDYPGNGLPVLCLPGLTRNARDFADLAEWFSASGHRVLCPDFRGRGDSEYAKDAATYTPAVYRDDVLALLDAEGIDRALFVGTSLGGIVTALVAAHSPDRIAAAVLNDIGPEIEAAGVERIREYVGSGGSWPTWMHAARALRDEHGDAHPDWDVTGWLAHAKRLMCIGNNGRIAYDYDMRIAEPFREPGREGPVDLWPAFEALGGRQLLILRGERSDLLSSATVQAMLARITGLKAVEVPGVGHPPNLTEPEARAAIAALSERAV